MDEFFDFIRETLGQSASIEAEDKKSEFLSIKQKKGELLLDYMNRLEVLKDEIYQLDGTDYTPKMVKHSSEV